MEGQEYLNQISASNRPAGKSGKGKFLSPKLLWIGLGCIGVLIVIIIIGALLGGNKTDNKSLSYALKLHLDNTAAVIKDYQDSVKSSNLRSSSASLYGILTNTSTELNTYLTDKYGSKEDKEATKKLKTDADAAKDALANDLFEAKINGILDRIYAHKMAYEISLIAQEEAKISSSAKDDTLKDLLNKSYDSLNTIYDKFNDFSETK